MEAMAWVRGNASGWVHTMSMEYHGYILTYHSALSGSQVNTLLSRGA